MAENKNSFVLYKDIIHTVRKLPKEKQADLFLTILEYVNDEDPDIDDVLIDLVFEPIKQSLKRDLKKYQNRCERNQENGKKGGRPPKEPIEKDPESKKPKKPTGIKVNPPDTRKPKKGDSDSDSVSDSESDNIINNAAFAKSCKDSPQWIETTAMQAKVSKDVINLFIDHFQYHLISMEEQKVNVAEFKRHFIHWLNKQPLEMHRNRPVGKSNQRQK